MSACDVSSFGSSSHSTVNLCTKEIDTKSLTFEDLDMTLAVGDTVSAGEGTEYKLVGFRKSGVDVLADLEFPVGGTRLRKCYNAMALQLIKRPKKKVPKK